MRHLSKSVAAVGVAALLITGGGAYALASAGGGTITVCVNHKNGTLYQARKCAKHDKKLRAGTAGPAGSPGAKGATGDTQQPSRWPGFPGSPGS